MSMKSSWNIEQACALLASDDCRGQSLLHLVMETLKAPKSVSFQQLLSMPKIQDLENQPETKPYFNVIALFAFGSYSDYKAAPEDSFPFLSTEHVKKLKMLSLLTLGARNRTLSYNTLMAALDVADISELEGLVIDCIYEGCMDAKLDQANRIVHIMRVEARDVHASHKAKMAACLQSWLKSCEDYRLMLETLAGEIDDYISSRTQQHEAILTTVDTLKREIAKSSQQAVSLGCCETSGLDDDDDVDMIDEPSRASLGSGMLY